MLQLLLSRQSGSISNLPERSGWHERDRHDYHPRRRADWCPPRWYHGRVHQHLLRPASDDDVRLRDRRRHHPGVHATAKHVPGGECVLPAVLCWRCLGAHSNPSAGALPAGPPLPHGRVDIPIWEPYFVCVCDDPGCHRRAVSSERLRFPDISLVIIITTTSPDDSSN